jgi:hypothetical protein
MISNLKFEISKSFGLSLKTTHRFPGLQFPELKVAFQ